MNNNSDENNIIFFNNKFYSCWLDTFLSFIYYLFYPYIILRVNINNDNFSKIIDICKLIDQIELS